MKTVQMAEQLKKMEKDIAYIKANMVDKDMVLSLDDFESLAETAKEKKAGKLISIREIENELGLC